MKFKENISYLFVEILTQNFQYAKIWTKIIFLVKKKFFQVCSGGISENLTPEVTRLSIHTSLFDIVVSFTAF